MNKGWQIYAEHILKAASKVFEIQHRDDISTDEILYDATLRNLQTLSEATQNLPDHLKNSHTNIPWKEISGFRNIRVHNYLGEIDPETVKGIVSQDLPPLTAVVAEWLETKPAK